MADIAIFRINYKSDFILTLNSDAGWMTPFCIKFWTGAPSQAYYAYYDGMSYTHCAPVDGEPTKLLVQFDDHHLPIGDLKFQIGYHFTVADFPTSVEDEFINQASVIIEVDDTPAQVMLDFNGETAPEIQFALPAYANEAQRIVNEQARIAAEEQRIANEQARISAEETRQTNEQQRISREQQRISQEQQRVNAEAERVSEFAELKTESEAATDAANIAATLSNEKAQLADDKAALAQAAADLANAKAQLAEDKAALANEKAALAQQKAEYAQEQGDAAKTEAETAHALNEEVSHDESTRQQQETARQQAESQRVTNFNNQMQQQQTAYTDAEAARDTAFDEAETERDAKVDEKVADITNLQAQIGYFVCDTAAATAAKTITATGYVLGTGGSIKVKMTNDNTVNNATLNINSTGAKPLFYEGARASSTNSWAAKDVLEIYYNGTNYQAKNVIPTFKTGEKIHNVGVDEEPTAGSENVVKSGGVQNALVNIGYYKGSLKRIVNVPFIVKKGDKIKITFTASEGVGISLKNASGGNVTTILVPSGESSVDTEYTAEDNIYYVCGSQGNVPNITMQSDRYDAKTAIDILSIAATLSTSGVMAPKYFASLVKSEYGDIKESGLIQNKIINSSGDWNYFRSILVPVSLLVGCKINVSYPPNATNPKISFLKTYDTSQAPDFCSGYSGRVDAGTYIIPSDCNYVLCNCGASTGSVDPDLIRIITNQDRFTDVENKLYNTFENNIDLSEEIVYNTMIRSTGYWYGGGVGACLLIDIEKFVGDNITIVYPEGSTNNHIAFLDTDSHVNGTLPDYNDAYNTDDKYISSGKYIIPNGCRYLYVELRGHSQSSAELTYPTIIISNDGMVNELAALRIAEQKQDSNNSKYYDINVDRLSYSDNMLDAPAYVYDDSVYSDRLEQFYALFDELAASYPNYITKYNLDELSGITNESYDSELYPIYMYRFNMLNSYSNKRPIRVMLISGTHIEYAAMFSVYNVMKNICEKWNQYEGLAQLRLNVEFIVIPCSSPWQIANNEVYNINDVNLNRNCGTLNWERDDTQHTGVSADSEYENKVFEWALLNYKPLAVYDLHNYTISNYTSDGRFTMPFCADAEILSMLVAMARDEELRFKKDFSGDAPSVDTPMTGASRYTETGTPGRRMLWAYDHGFKVSANIEIRPAQIWHNGEINISQAVYGEADCIKIGVDVYTNALFYTIKKITELKL